jgi:hypothetical protein
MKKANLTIVATIIATFVISMIAFQPTATEASNNVSPAATPSPRGKRPRTIQSPKPVQSPIPRRKSVKQTRRNRGIPAPTPSPVTRQIGVPAPTPSPEN